MTDPHNCGTLGFDVATLPHVASAICQGGHPVIVTCAGLYLDTDLDPLDGCEAVVVDAYEPNNTEDTATFVQRGGSIGGLTIHSAADVDWITVVVPCTSTALPLDAHGVPTGWNVECRGTMSLLGSAPGIEFAPHENPSGVTPRFLWQHDHVFTIGPTLTPPETETFSIEIGGVDGAIGPYSLSGWQ